MSTTATVADVIAEHADDPDVAVYYSKHTNLILTRVNHVEDVGRLGNVRQLQRGLQYRFAPTGTLVVRKGQDLIADGEGGAMQDAVEWLDSHVNINTTFHREGHEPDRPLPTERDFLTDINNAVVVRDQDAIVGMLTTEQATHKRKVLIDAAVSALEALRDAGEDVPLVPAKTGFEDLSREDMVKLLQDAGVEIPAEITDDQLRSSLMVLKHNGVTK